MKKKGGISNCVKILDDAVKKCGSIPNLQRELAAIEAHITTAALYKAHLGQISTLKPEIIVAIAHLVYNGDGNKLLKALEYDFLPVGLK